MSAVSDMIRDKYEVAPMYSGVPESSTRIRWNTPRKESRCEYICGDLLKPTEEYASNSLANAECRTAK